MAAYPYPYAHYPPQSPPHYPPQYRHDAYNSYSQQYSHPTPYPPSDQNGFRQYYAAQLSALTMNSRPLIQGLSALAQDYARLSYVVVQCLDAHIRSVPPEMKLPAFYLLDAICKNFPDPYVNAVSPIVQRLFLDTYYSVDSPTRLKMEEMLVTWRSHGSRGSELFGVAVQLGIEREIFGDRRAAPHLNNQRARSERVTRSQVLAEIEVTYHQQERLLHDHPDNATIRQHVDVLSQLRHHVQTQPVTPQDLSAILEQMRSMQARTSHLGRRPSPPRQVYPSSVAEPSRPIPNSEMKPDPSLPVHNGYELRVSTPVQSTLGSASLTGLVAHSSSASGTGVSTPQLGTANTGDITNLLNSLLKSGVVGSASTAGSSSKSEITKVSDHETEAARLYEKKVLNMHIKLTSSNLMKHQPQHLNFLHDDLSSQCKQCAIRFPNGPLGKKKLDDHLDLHFRQNKRASENVGRGHSRSWFVGIKDWMNPEKDRKGKVRDVSGVDGGDTKESRAEMLAKLRALKVVIPPGDEAKSVSCPICKEVVESVFVEEDEEWVWKNAASVQGKVYHATCRAEAVASTSLAIRLLGESINRSRSGTPESSAMRRSITPTPMISPSKLGTFVTTDTSNGGKRKAESDDEGTGTPPSKKPLLERAS